MKSIQTKPEINSQLAKFSWERASRELVPNGPAPVPVKTVFTGNGTFNVTPIQQIVQIVTNYSNC